MSSLYDEIMASQRSASSPAGGSLYDEIMAAQRGGSDAQDGEPTPEQGPTVLRTPDGKQQRHFAAGVDESREWRETEHAQETISGGQTVRAPRVGPIKTPATKRESFSVPAEAMMTAEGTAKFLEGKLGRGSVYMDDQDRVFILTPEERKKPVKEQRPVIFNRPGLSKADLAIAPLAVSSAALGVAAAPLVPAAAQAMGGGMLAKTAAATGVAAGTGLASSGLQQATGAALGEEATPEQRATHAGVSAAGEVAGLGLGNALVGAARVVSGPSKWARGLLEKTIAKSDPKTYVENVELGERLGTNFDAAQLSQKNVWLRIRGFFQTQPLAGAPLDESQVANQVALKGAAERLVSDLGAAGTKPDEIADGIVRHYTKQLDGLEKARNKVVEAMGPGGREEAATAAMGEIESKLSSLQATRAAAAERDFGKLDPKTMIDVTKRIETIDKLLEEFAGGSLTNSKIAAIKFLKADRAALLAGAEDGIARIPIKHFKNDLSTWGRLAGRAHNAIDGVTDRTVNEAVASGYYKSMLADLDAATELNLSSVATMRGGKKFVSAEAFKSAAENQKQAMFLKTARDNYKAMSAQLDVIRENPVAQFIDSPEQLVTMLGQKDKAVAAQQALEMLDKHSPAHARAVRAAYMEDLFSRARVSGDKPDPKSLAQVIGRNRARIDRVYAGDQAGRSAIRELEKAAGKLSENPLREFVGRPEAIVSELGKKDNRRHLRGIMRYIRAIDEDGANKIVGSYVNRLIEASGPGSSSGVHDVLRPGALAQALEKNLDGISIALDGNKKAIDAVHDLIRGGRVLSNMAGQGVSPTQSRQAIAKMLETGATLVAAGAIGSGLAQGDAGAALDRAKFPIAYLLATRYVSKAIAYPTISKAYAQAYRAAADPSRLAKDKTFQRATIMALSSISSWAQQVDADEQPEQ